MSQADLLREPVDAEVWLLKRLQDHGIDIYAGGEFESAQQRIAWTLVEFRWASVIAGRHQGKPETYEQLFLRMYGVALAEVAKQTNPTRIARNASGDAP